MTDKFSKELEPNEVVRKRHGYKFFGFKPTALNEKIRSGEIPAPIPMSDDGRAMAWFGWQIIEHQKKRLAAAKAVAAKAAKKRAAR